MILALVITGFVPVMFKDIADNPVIGPSIAPHARLLVRGLVTRGFNEYAVLGPCGLVFRNGQFVADADVANEPFVSLTVLRPRLRSQHCRS